MIIIRSKTRRGGSRFESITHISADDLERKFDRSRVYRLAMIAETETGEVIGQTWQTSEGELYQTDWEFPALAESLGWSIRRVQNGEDGPVHLAHRPKNGCDHCGTDGTITCPDCGLDAGDFISAAREYLDRLV